MNGLDDDLPDFCNKMGGSFKKNKHQEKIILSCNIPEYKKEELGKVTFNFVRDGSFNIISPKAGIIREPKVKYIRFIGRSGNIKETDADKDQTSVRCEGLKNIEIIIGKSKNYSIHIK